MANLLVTYEPTHEKKATDEINSLLSSVGESPTVEEGISGTFFVTVKNPKQAVRKLSKAFEDDPEQFSYTKRWVPADKWCSSKTKDMMQVIREIDSKMDPKKSWKMEVHKRGAEKSSIDIIKELTEGINKPNVDLKKPDVIVSVEIIGDRAALSLLGRGEWLNAARK
ncbi:MAG: THUMP domain-containing protein [Candidatus Aenigmarchaeota archaeon]|nr:THUMP domain-containing protein [Candidatus Aenigmarchaeota archaeon]